MKVKSAVLKMVGVITVMLVLASTVYARTVGVGYFDALVIGPDRANPTMTVSTGGAIVGTSISTTTTYTATTASFSSTLSVGGNSYFGAAATKSTVTVAGAASFAASVTAPTVTGSTLVTGAAVTASAGPLTLYSRSKAQILALDPTVAGEFYYCSDCTTVTTCVSTGTAVGQWALITDRAAPCD